MEVSEEVAPKSTPCFEFIKTHSDVIVDGLSGGMAGLISTFILHPLENIRTRLQNHRLQKEERIDPDMNLNTGNDKQQKKSKFNQLEFMKEVIKKEGVFAFYKGLKVSMFGSVVAYGIYFLFYRLFK